MTMTHVTRAAAVLAFSLLMIGRGEAQTPPPAPQPAAPTTPPATSPSPVPAPAAAPAASSAPPSAAPAATPAPATPPMHLTLAEAIQIATSKSESIDIARADVTRAGAETQRATAQKLPQVSLSGGYTRTFASEFSDVFKSTGPSCAPLDVDPTKPLADRVAELERAASCGAIVPDLGFNLTALPFGQANEYDATISVSQALYAGGRIAAQQAEADLSRRLAQFSLSAADAQATLDVTQAFYDAALSDRLVVIAQSGYDQAAATYDQTRQAYEAGRQPEFELLRAQVARDSNRPTVIRSRANRDIAYLHLRQLLKLPSDTPLVLDVDLDDPTLAPPAPFADALASAETKAAESIPRVSVQQAAATVSTREAAISVARAERRPTVDLSTAYGKVAYPSGAFPSSDDFRTNWTAGISVQVPIFTGGRLKADEISAEADLTEAQAELKQARELAVLDSATAQQDLAAAKAVWDASAGTIEQAQRAYEIAELRNREGLSTQLELSDSRLSLQQAEANRAQAARDLQVARARVALLPNLPVSTR